MKSTKMKSAQKPNYDFPNLTEEIVNNVKAKNSYYDFQAIDFLVNSEIDPQGDVAYYGAGTPLKDSLENFKHSNKARAVISVHVALGEDGEKNHFTALYLEREDDDSYSASYIDPTGLDSISMDVLLDLISTLGIESDKVVKTSNMIQFNQDGVVMNSHCGAFTAEILIYLAGGRMKIENERLKFCPHGNEFYDVRDFDDEASDAYGLKLRNYHSASLSGAESVRDSQKYQTPKKQIIGDNFESWHSPLGEVILASGLNRLKITPEDYRRKTFVSGSATGINKGRIKLDVRSKSAEKRSASSTFPIIIQTSSSKYDIEKSTSNKSGHDELFQFAKVGEWKKLSANPDPNFPTPKEASKLARIRTKELHSFKNGHVGSMVGNLATAGYFKEHGKQDAKQGWDPDKRSVIQKVFDAAKTRSQTLSAPIKATAELLKLATEKVVKYKDNTLENRNRFGNRTGSGLDLTDDVDREYALKTSQAARDKFKLSTVALEKRWNDQDSDKEDHEKKDPKSIIKRKVQRTKISSEFHGGKDRNFTPVRGGTPYSDFNFDYNFEELQKAAQLQNKDNYKAITTVFSSPTPVIKPSSEFKKEIEKAVTELKKKQSEPLNKTTKSEPIKPSQKQQNKEPSIKKNLAPEFEEEVSAAAGKPSSKVSVKSSEKLSEKSEQKTKGN